MGEIIWQVQCHKKLGDFDCGQLICLGLGPYSKGWKEVKMPNNFPLTTLYIKEENIEYHLEANATSLCKKKKVTQI